VIWALLLGLRLQAAPEVPRIAHDASDAPSARSRPQASATAPVQGADSLLVAARRAADRWMRHDFDSLVGTGAAVMVHLPGAEPSSPLRPTQAAQLLRAFAEGTREIEVTVLVARNVDPDRAYVEAQRVYQPRNTDLRRSQALYFGFRRTATGYRLVEIRALP